mgnify:CR=1 FL=1
MDNQILTIIIGVVALLAGIGAGKFLFAKNTRRQVEEAELQTQKMIADAKTQAETLKKEKLLEAKERFVQLKSEHEKEVLEVLKQAKMPTIVDADALMGGGPIPGVHLLLGTRQREAHRRFRLTQTSADFFVANRSLGPGLLFATMVAANIGAVTSIFGGTGPDTLAGGAGSLALGGIIAALAVMVRKEWLIPIFCGVFLVENLSVMIQVSYFKYTRKKYGEGQRVFLMSPLHHHYQKLGYHESKIAVRFWVVTLMCIVFAILSLKLR